MTYICQWTSSDRQTSLSCSKKSVALINSRKNKLVLEISYKWQIKWPLCCQRCQKARVQKAIIFNAMRLSLTKQWQSARASRSKSYQKLAKPFLMVHCKQASPVIQMNVALSGRNSTENGQNGVLNGTVLTKFKNMTKTAKLIGKELREIRKIIRS